MAWIFSCTERFSRSYLRNTFLNRGIVRAVTKASPAPRNGTTNRKIQAIRPPMRKAMAKANTSIRGARMAVRMIIM